MVSFVYMRMWILSAYLHAGFHVQYILNSSECHSGLQMKSMSMPTVGPAVAQYLVNEAANGHWISCNVHCKG